MARRILLGRSVRADCGDYRLRESNPPGFPNGAERSSHGITGRVVAVGLFDCIGNDLDRRHPAFSSAGHYGMVDTRCRLSRDRSFRRPVRRGGRRIHPVEPAHHAHRRLWPVQPGSSMHPDGVGGGAERPHPHLVWLRHLRRPEERTASGQFPVFARCDGGNLTHSGDIQ